MSGTRRVFVTPATQHPNEAWVTEQAEAFVRHARAKKLGAEIIMHDRDTKFTAGFDAVLKKAGLDARRIGLSGTQHGGLCRAVRAEHQARMPRLLRGVRPAAHGSPLPGICRPLSCRAAASGLGQRVAAATSRQEGKRQARLDSSGRRRLPHSPRRPPEALPPQGGVAEGSLSTGRPSSTLRTGARIAGSKRRNAALRAVGPRASFTSARRLIVRCDPFSTRSIKCTGRFLINVPIGLFSLIAAHALVDDPEYLKRERAELSGQPLNFDYIGLSLLVLIMSAWEIMLSKGQEWDWLGDPFGRVQTLMIVFVLGLALLIFREFSIAHPIIDFRVLGERNFAVSCVVMFCAFGASMPRAWHCQGCSSRCSDTTPFAPGW